MPDFPHMDTSTEFPHGRNVDVYKFDNGFDYSRYDYDQMKITVCRVPWDMGEAHIGARTISGIGNVVYFGSKANRDAWFAAIPDSECFRFETKYRKLHRDLYIDVPLPFDVAATYNYVAVEYAMFANDDSPVRYEDEDGHRKWFWFIREVEMKSANTTRLHILDDAFQTWIYDIDISGMILERGHAPMFATDVDDYLMNPMNNNENLLTEDVNYGEADTVRHVDAIALNAGTMYACIATTANPTGNWGSKANDNWRTPASAYYTNSSVFSVRVFACAVEDVRTLLINITNDYPQFKQTIQGIFFVSSQLVTLGDAFTFAGVSCHDVGATRKTINLMTLDKAMFGYPANYADIAKLYTSPYAHIEVTNENGDVDYIKIEDSTGTINVSACLSLAYPFVNVDAHLIGTGGSAGGNITFRNITERTFSFGGGWYKTLKSWKVPTFAVILDSSKEYDYNTHFDRAQRVIDYTTTYGNSVANATTAQANANASADTAQTNTGVLTTAEQSNANANATLTTDNATLATTANDAITNVSNASVDRSTNITTSYNFDVFDSDNAITDATATSTIQAQEEQAAISAASGAAQSAIGAISSAASGNIAGAISSAVSGLVGGAATLASSSVSVNLTAAKAAIAEQNNQYHAEAATTKTQADAGNQKTTATNITDAQNTLTTGQAANAAATTIANAARSKTAQDTAAANTNATEKANALRAYNTEVANAERTRSQAQSAITNDTAQAALRAPFVYGSFADGDSAVTKPIALFANVVTQSKAAISCAGDEMLRYGYMLDRQWPFNGNWNVGKYFTYWKLKDFWVSNLNVPDMYMDKIRFFLFGGVTVWRNPDDIGKRSIYDNFD